jgi:hypothetical protein
MRETDKVWNIKKISLCVKNKSSLLSHTDSVLRACFDGYHSLLKFATSFFFV